MDIILIVIQIVLLAVSIVMLWQIWQFLKRKDIPEDDHLDEKRTKYLTDRLNVLQVCIIAEVVLYVVHFVMEIVEQMV